MHDVCFSTEVPGATTKSNQLDTAHKASTLEMLDQEHNTKMWTHVYTVGYSDSEVRNGGSGIHISFSNGKTFSKSLVAGALSSTTGPNLIIIIIIAFKGAIRDFLQSPHSAANCLQHVRSSGPGATMCKSHETHQALITCKCHVTCHLVRRDSSAIKFDRVEIAFI